MKVSIKRFSSEGTCLQELAYYYFLLCTSDAEAFIQKSNYKNEFNKILGKSNVHSNLEFLEFMIMNKKFKNVIKFLEFIRGKLDESKLTFNSSIIIAFYEYCINYRRSWLGQAESLIKYLIKTYKPDASDGIQLYGVLQRMLDAGEFDRIQQMTFPRSMNEKVIESIKSVVYSRNMFI